MKRSQRLKASASALVVLGLLVALAWLIGSLASGVGLLMNGPWLAAILLTALGAVLAFASMAAEDREREESRQTYLAVERAKERRDARR